MTSFILASDFGNLGTLVIALPALGVALLVGLVGALMRRRWMILSASTLSLLTALFLFWASRSVGPAYPHSTSDSAELQFFAAAATGLGLLTLLGLLLPRD